jgi:2-polyprenyl-3-methyl-5-hydroxy-6-metoxy-1,4-benzoquinol methylase
VSLSFAEFAAASPYTDAVDHKKLLFIYRALEDFAAERRGDVSDLRMLDTGSGVGGVALPLARTGARVTAIDIDANRVASLRTAARDFANLDAQVGDAVTFRSSEPFDVVVASKLVDRVPDAGRLLDNLVSHLPSDGLLVVTTSNGLRRRHPYAAPQLEQLFARSGLHVHRFMNSGFVLSASKHLRRHPTLGSFDADFANLVPHWMASGWYIALRRAG